MIKKLPFLFLVILLSFNGLSFSQVESPYSNFNPEDLKNHKDYSKNFNAGNYSTKVFYNCMIDLIDAARKEYCYLDPFLHNIAFDSTAQFQADYQALKNERTDLNVAPYKTIFYRLKKFGLSNRGTELLTKGKATLGVQEFSYYDACMELLRPILKNVKLADVLLDKKYSYIGFGFETDEYMKTMYASIVLGNDRTFRHYVFSPMDKMAPMEKGKAGMDYFDAAICKKCLDDYTLEELSSFVSVNKDGEVYLECNDSKALKKMIGREGDAIVLDFVQTSQYDCDNIIVDNDKIFRGFPTKPITFLDIIEANEAEAKSLKVRAKIADLPEMIALDADYEIDIIILKEGKVACRTIIPKSVEAYNAHYTDKINFMKDLTSFKTAGEWVATSEQSEFSIKVPFTDMKKMNYLYSDFDTMITNVQLPAYKINSIEIIACNSLNYISDPTQIKYQKQRATSIQKSLASVYPNAPITISYADSWEDFQTAIVNSAEYYDLSFDKNEAIQKLRANNGKVAKELEAEYLSKQRYAKIVFHITFVTDGEDEQKFVNYKFNKTLAEKNYVLAFAIQKYMMNQVDNKRYKATYLDEMVIPTTKQYVAFLNNQLYMKYFFAKSLDAETAKQMKKLLVFKPESQVLMYNNVICKVYDGELTSITQITELQAQIDKLYTLNNIVREEVNNLNIDFQIKILDYLQTAPKNNEAIALKNNTLLKIKSIRNPVMPSWQAAYKLASIFVKYLDYDYAIDIMTPFLDNSRISEDFLFSYISLLGHKEDTYMSSLFIKAVKLAKEKNISYLCALLNKMSMNVLDNEEVRKISCEFCK